MSVVSLHYIDYYMYFRPISVTAGNRTYHINIQGEASGCTDSVVCLLPVQGTAINVGAMSKRKFFFEGEFFLQIFIFHIAILCSVF